MKWFIIVLLLFSLQSCATLTPKGEGVRITSHHEDIENCKCLGQVTSSSAWGGIAAQGVAHDSAINELKNKAGKIGANVVLTQIITNNFIGTRMVGDAYKCHK